MHNNLKFKVSSGLKNIIGRELITDDFIAIFELVKNAFDAYATEVIINFESSGSYIDKIVIIDNGKGMDFYDITNKWLFVAYSAKQDGTEDDDYRNKIRKYYAGAKGIGRFSCDKLGSMLRMITTKDSPNAETQELIVDWEKFEQDIKEEFINIDVQHQVLSSNPSDFSHGTTLEIYNLRSDSIWDREKILKLKSSLSKLINPFADSNKKPFTITIKSDLFRNIDGQYTEEKDKVNGPIKNIILDVLNLKTTKIVSTISNDGERIITELSNNGEWLYKINEINTEYKLIHDIYTELYFLDQRAKNNFTRLMGLRSSDYGSVFLYKNGIRIYPFGEPNEDSFSLDSRRARKLGNFVGTNDLIGRIEILGENENLKESTSRVEGLIKNSHYEQLIKYFLDKVIVKLESFRRNIVRYGIDLEEFENSQHSKEQIIRLIADISNNDNLISIEFNSNLLEIIDETQESNNSAKSILKNIEKIAIESKNDRLLEQISKVKDRLQDAIIIAEIAEEEVRIKDREIREKETQNLFLKSLKSQDFSELVSLMHHIGISSDSISNYVKFLSYKVENKIHISDEELKEVLGKINFENQKILSISRFATKANFRVNSEDQTLDMIEFFHEYIDNIINNYHNDIKINIKSPDNTHFRMTFKPIEMTILIDNLINNSKKARARNLNIEINPIAYNKIEIIFKDDGIGVPRNDRKRIFDYGFTTTGGAGLGLTHIQEILSRIRSSIRLDTTNEIGAKFILTFNK
jgi:signal transduction histidine kinase